MGGGLLRHAEGSPGTGTLWDLGVDAIPRGLAAHGYEVQGNVSRRCQRGGRDSFEFRPGISGRQTAQGYEIDRECPRGIDGGILGFAERGGLGSVSGLLAHRQRPGGV